MASVVFAVVLSILMQSMKEGMLYKMQENVVTFYTGAIQVLEPEYWEEKSIEYTFVVSDTLEEKLDNSPGVVGYANRLESFALAASDDNTKGCMVVGIDAEKEPLITGIKDKVIVGEYLLDEDNAVLVAEGLAEYLKLQVRDTLVLLGQGYHGVSAAGKYVIKGIVELASPDLNKRLVYLPNPLARNLFGAENRSTAIILKIEDINQATSIVAELEPQLQDYDLMSWKELLPELNQTIDRERQENVIFLFVLYLLISFGIFGTILMMLMERQFEFGIMMAVGMRRSSMAFVVILENILISLLGSFVGLLLSFPVVQYLHNNPIEFRGNLKEVYENFGFEPIFYFSNEAWIFYSQSIIVLGIALVLSLYPLVKILRLNPIEAMHK